MIPTTPSGEYRIQWRLCLRIGCGSRIRSGERYRRPCRAIQSTATTSAPTSAEVDSIKVFPFSRVTARASSSYRRSRISTARPTTRHRSDRETGAHARWTRATSSAMPATASGGVTGTVPMTSPVAGSRDSITSAFGLRCGRRLSVARAIGFLSESLAGLQAGELLRVGGLRAHANWIVPGAVTVGGAGGHEAEPASHLSVPNPRGGVVVGMVDLDPVEPRFRHPLDEVVGNRKLRPPPQSGMRQSRDPSRPLHQGQRVQRCESVLLDVRATAGPNGLVAERVLELGHHARLHDRLGAV